MGYASIGHLSVCKRTNQRNQNDAEKTKIEIGRRNIK